MARKQDQKQNPSSSDTGEMGGNVDQIREILFGAHMRKYEQRFAELEKRLGQDFERMSNDFEKRLERVNTYAKREIDKLTEQFKAERKDRIAENRQGLKELEQLTNQVEAWFAEVEDQFDVESKELRAALHEQNEELGAMIHETRESADGKLDVDELAQLFSEIAVRLKKASRSSKT
jgi:hypothetical protein